MRDHLDMVASSASALRGATAATLANNSKSGLQRFTARLLPASSCRHVCDSTEALCPEQHLLSKVEAGAGDVPLRHSESSETL